MFIELLVLVILAFALTGCVSVTKRPTTAPTTQQLEADLADDVTLFVTAYIELGDSADEKDRRAQNVINRAAVAANAAEASVSLDQLTRLVVTLGLRQAGVDDDRARAGAVVANLLIRRAWRLTGYDISVEVVPADKFAHARRAITVAADAARAAARPYLRNP